MHLALYNIYNHFPCAALTVLLTRVEFLKEWLNLYKVDKIESCLCGKLNSIVPGCLAPTLMTNIFNTFIIPLYFWNLACTVICVIYGSCEYEKVNFFNNVVGHGQSHDNRSVNTHNRKTFISLTTEDQSNPLCTNYYIQLKYKNNTW